MTHLTTEIRYPRKKRKNKNWIPPVFVIGIFLGVFTFAILGKYTLISVLDLSKILAFFCFVPLLIPARIYKEKLGLFKTEAFIVSTIGVGPIVASLLLWINFLTAFNPTTTVYKIEDRIVSNSFGSIVVFQLEGNAYEEFSEARTFDVTAKREYNAKTLKLTVGTGLFGYEVIKERELE